MNNNTRILYCDKCTKCSQDFPTTSNFYRHVRSHGKKQEAGDQCSKVFVTKDHLTKHMNSVHTENNIKCQDCDKVFKTQTHLNNHNLVHNDKQLSCISCGRLYKNSRTLKKHSCNDKLDISNANQQNKPDKKKHENYVCLICRKKFKNSYLLEKHICIDNDNSFINEYIGVQKICDCGKKV